LEVQVKRSALCVVIQRVSGSQFLVEVCSVNQACEVWSTRLPVGAYSGCEVAVVVQRGEGGEELCRELVEHRVWPALLALVVVENILEEA
jgi:hypothetical protein